MTDKPYQVMPDLSEEEFRLLKEDIDKRGVLVAVEYDDRGNILDGHHRVRACEELGIKEWPKQIRYGLSDSEKRVHARQLNLARRHLNQAQKQELISDQLRDTPSLSSRAIAARLGVHHTTVQTVRDRLVDGGEISHHEEVEGRDGVRQPARKPMKSAFIPEPDNMKAQVAVVNKAKATAKKEKKQEREQFNAQLAADIAPASERYVLYNEPCINAKSREACTFDWIVTDPPYPKEFLPVYDDLAEIAEHSLKPGGSLLCMIGQSYLPEIVAALSKRLTYHWTIAYLTPGGQATQVWPRKVNTFWKPILWFTKGDYSNYGWIGDATRSAVNDNDKTRHHWGQSETGMHDLMRRFVKPGDTVLDPFMGAGTTGVVALELGATFTGYDIDKQFFNETKVRFSNDGMEKAA